MPITPRSAIVWGIQPCACCVTDWSVRWRRRAFSKAPAPTPSSGRSLNTRYASRQYLPRDEDAANTRPPPSSGATLVSLVSSWMRSPIPRSLNATEVNAPSGARHATATAATPTRLRSRADGARCSTTTSTAAPTSTSSTTSSSTSAPKSPATASFADSGWRLFVNGSLVSAQAATADAATSGSTSTGRLRRRSGTSANQTIAPTAAAAAAPRDCVSRMASDADPHARVGEHARDGGPRPARAEPERDRHRHRGDAPDRVPVVERLAEPVRDLVLGQRAGPYARRERVGHRHDGADQESEEQLRGRARRDLRAGHRGGEHRQVGERAPGLDVAQLRDDRPHDRHRRQEREQREHQQRRHAVDRPRAAPQERRGDHRAAGEDHQDPGDRRAR